MRLIAKILISILVNFAALFVADHFIPGIDLAADLWTVLGIAGILTLLNFLLKPLLKLLFGPLILLTMGLALLVVNMIVLKLLDFLAPGLSIAGIVALIEAAIVVGAVNFILHSATKHS
jgi:putative membrane protein